MDTLGRKIQLYQGLLSTMPSDLAEGEPAVAFDDVTGLPQLFVGTASGNKRIQAEQWIIDDLISTEKGASLSANQGRLLKEMIDAIGAGGSSVNVIDNLLSNSPVSALSARQGKVVNEKIISHENNQSDEKHIEFVDTEPVDLTNTGVVFLRRDENSGAVPGQPTMDELKQEVRRLEQDLNTHEKKIASETELGHIKVDGNTIKVNPVTGIASIDAISQIETLIETKADKALETPTEITLTNTWKSPTSSVYPHMTYYKDGFGIVHLSGAVQKINSFGQLSFTTLPVGYRPNRTVTLTAIATTGNNAGEFKASYVRINMNGVCEALDGGSDSHVTVEGSYRVNN